MRLVLEPELVNVAPIEINGSARQIDSFMYLAPGVQGSAGGHNINGGVTFENEVQFNGVPVAFVDYSGNQTNINPPYEAVSEFRVDSSTFSAQYGLGQGAVTFNMASGTNKFHGDGFEILRNQLFDSDGFFPTRFSSDGRPAPPINQQNNYGFSIGGPLSAPKLYDGRNRTFFHVSVDWFKQNQALNTLGTVPTVAEKQGDFSSFVDANGNVIPIYDPQTGKQFPGNVIPQERFSAVSKSILPSIPDPDRPGIVFGQQQNKSPAISSIAIRQTLWSYTLDHTISPRQSIHFSQWDNESTSPNFTAGAPIVAPSNPIQSELTNASDGYGMLANYALTVTPNLVITAGADRIGNVSGQHNANRQVSFPGVTNSSTFPLVNFDGQNAPTTWGVAGGAFFECCSGGGTDINNRRLGAVIVSNTLWNHGRHTFNIGGQYRRTYQDIIACQFCSGSFNFSHNTTSTPNASDPNFGSYGSAFASFLLGQADAAIRIYANELRMRNREFAYYAQDQVRFNSKFTASIGLRYDIMVPFTEDHDNIIFVDEKAPNPGAGNLLGAATKFGNCTGCSGIHRADIHWKYLQPRVGLAYQLNSKTAFRSGFYMSRLDGGAYEYGTAQSASFMSSLLDGQFLRASTNSNNPGYGSWDTTPLPSPSQAPFSPSIGNGGVIFAFDKSYVGTSPYISAWSADVQRELPWNNFLTIAYVGNRSVHLPATLKLNNQPNPSVLKYGDLLSKSITDPAAAAAGIQTPYPDFVAQFGNSATVEQALTPFPQFGGYFPVYEMDGTSFFNALQVQAEKRFSGGVSYLANFMMSRNSQYFDRLGAVLTQRYQRLQPRP